jgi:NADH:ubiquinone oxidoreductase subunit K
MPATWPLSPSAACEVVVGLGLIVALFRRKLPLNVDDLRELRG